jgi:molybdate/tungstate transport system substrate-binding protein
MTRRRLFGRRPWALVTKGVSLLAGISLTLTGTPSGASSAPGTVKILAAGSLSNVLTRLEPAFHAATGDTLQVTLMGSTELASGIKAKSLLGDIFLSASLGADQALEGSANGAWISRYSLLGTSPVVLAYRATSTYAHPLLHRPWYSVITDPGFVLGRTDPTVDPGGVLDLDALKGIGYAYNEPALLTLAGNARDIYPESALPGLLQAGQLDGAFMYAVSARAAGLPFVPLVGTKNLAATYTVATLKGAPDARAAATFVQWLSSARAKAILVAQGLALNPRFAG